MDWRSIAFDWNRTRAFLAAAEEGSLSAAARALGQSQPTLGRQIRALEEELGIALFERAASGLAPTPAGLELLDHVRAMAEAAGHVSRLASGQSQSVEGAIRLSVSQLYAVHLLPAMLASLAAKAPALEVEIIASNENADLRRREADIAVRHVQPQDPELIGRRVAEHRIGLYATPAYLASIPPLARPEDFVHAGFIGFDENRAWRETLLGLGLTLGEQPFRHRSADHNVHWALALQGLGIGVAAAMIGDAEPRLTRVAPWLPLAIPVWLVAHRELATSRRIRLVYDHLAEAIARLPAAAAP